MALLAALCVAVATTTFLYTMLAKSAPITDRRLATIITGRSRANTYQEGLEGRPSRADALRTKLRQVLPSRWLDRLGDLLVTTGITAPPETVAVIWGMIAFGPFLAYLVLAGGLPAGTGLLLPLGILALGAYGPLIYLRGKAKSRANRILLNLPDAMDLLTTCVEAGLGIDAAIARVAEKAKEPLAAELRTVLRTMAMGGTRRDALTQLAARVKLAEIQSFTSAVIQAEMMGVSLGQVLRVQSDALRVARKQRAEQQAFKAPVKIIVVLALFIFPTMFIVILGPAALTLINSGFR